MDLRELENSALVDLDKASTPQEIEQLYSRYLGRKDGQLTNILRSLSQLSIDEKKSVGQAANDLRIILEKRFSEKKLTIEKSLLESQIKSSSLDVTLPSHQRNRGSSHPVLSTLREVVQIFKRLGFDAVEGPEVESDFNNFTALNIPLDHPARDMHDTFYLNKNEVDAQGKVTGPFLLRTHTSPVQIRLMKEMKPPVRIIAPGRVFRHEAVDATHAAVFHQIEGLAIDKHISFADLKGTLTLFAQQLLGKETRVRFRPSYFPFVEPGAEMDIEWTFKNEKGETKKRWLEMLGAGLVHPQVLRNVGYDPEVYSGFAFGMGIERIVLTKYKVQDIRTLLESDLRFLEQFS